MRSAVLLTPGWQALEQVLKARRAVALLPGMQEQQVDAASEKDAAGEVNRVVHAQPDAACHDEHCPGDDGAADETAAAVGKADDAGKE